MIAGAFIHIAALASLLWFLRQVTLPTPLIPTALLVLVFAIPFGGENTLWGFESANYFMLLLGIWTVALTSTSAAWSRRWTIGYILGVGAIFAMAAAGTALAAAGAITAVQLAAQARPRIFREFAAMLLLCATGATLLAITPHPPGYLDGRAPSLLGFAWSLGLAGGWPVTIPAIGPAIVHSPALCLLWLLYRQRAGLMEADWRIVALAGWVGLQAAGTAYTRYPGPIASRYLDTLGLACVINACALVAIARRWDRTTRPAWVYPVGSAWLAGILACLLFQAVYSFPRAYFFDPRVRDGQLINISTYLVTRRFGHVGPMPYALTYGDPPRLAVVLDQPLVRGLLPVELGSTPAERTAATNRLRMKGGLALGWRATSRMAMMIGLALLVGGMWLYGFLAFLRWIPAVRPASKMRFFSEERA